MWQIHRTVNITTALEFFQIEINIPLALALKEAQYSELHSNILPEPDRGIVALAQVPEAINRDLGFVWDFADSAFFTGSA